MDPLGLMVSPSGRGLAITVRLIPVRLFSEGFRDVSQVMRETHQSVNTCRPFVKETSEMFGRLNHDYINIF